MPDKFIVPQFIDNEDKILGPITVRQFLICLGTVFVLFIEYKIFVFAYFVIIGIITAGIGAVFAFLKVNGQPFHIFFVNFVQTQMRAKLRIWHKNVSDAELKRYISTGEAAVTQERTPRKERPSTRHLRDLALTVNTGGVYNTEDDPSLYAK